MMKERGIRFVEEQLLAPEQALVLYAARAQLAAPREERVALDDADGRICARDIVADANYPAQPRSTMDGFAVRAADTPGTLRIAGEVRIGEADCKPLQPGTAVRIATGANLPGESDAVVPVESVSLANDRVTVDAVRSGACISPAAADMRRGETLLRSGTRLRPPDIGVLATLGITAVPVFVRPRIAVISSGDELVAPHAAPQAGQIRDSNRYAIAAALRELGGVPVHQPIARDDPAELEAILRGALAENDGVVLSGGSSVGERDFTPDIVARVGNPGVIVHGLRVKPGKPTVLGAIGGKAIFGLPGNPASALLILYALCAPIVAAMTGTRRADRHVPAVLEEPIHKRAGWTWYVPVSLQEGPTVRARPLAIRSSAVSLLARASGFATLGEAVSFLPAQATIAVTRFS